MSMNRILDGAATIQNVRDAINATGTVLAEINADKTGLKLTDLTAAAPAPTPIFHVDSVNTSKIAQVLGIFGGDVSSATGTTTTISSAVDHVIDGNPISRLATLTPSERIFFRELPGKNLFSADLGIDATALQLSANFGFIGISLHGHGNLAAKVSFDLASGSPSPTLSDLAVACAASWKRPCARWPMAAPRSRLATLRGGSLILTCDKKELAGR